MKAVIVTEAEFDVYVIRRVLESTQPAIESVEFLAADGWSAADSLARSIVASRSLPVALAVDANESDIEHAQERQRFLEASIEMVGVSPTRAKVVLFVPAIEIVFFKEPKSMTEMNLTEREQERAKYDPRGLLDEIMQSPVFSDVTDMPSSEYSSSVEHFWAVESRLKPRWDQIAEEIEFRELVEFLRKVAT